MRKILIIAWSDFRQTVFTRTFLISVVLMPVVLFGVLMIEIFSVRNVDLKDRRIAVIDGTGQLYGTIVKEAEKRNRGGRVFRRSSGGMDQVAPRYLLESSPAEGRAIADIEIALSERVRRGELSAFAIIGNDVMVPGGGRTHRVAYYSNAPTKAIGLMKKMLNKSYNSTLDEMLEYEAYCQEIAGRSEDYKEGVKAFLEKRAPRFTGK